MSTIELFGTTYVSRESLQEATGFGAPMFRRAEERDGLPPIRLGKRIYYAKPEVEKWIAKCTYAKKAA